MDKNYSMGRTNRMPAKTRDERQKALAEALCALCAFCTNALSVHASVTDQLDESLLQCQDVTAGGRTCPGAKPR